MVEEESYLVVSVYRSRKSFAKQRYKDAQQLPLQARKTLTTLACEHGPCGKRASGAPHKGVAWHALRTRTRHAAHHAHLLATLVS
ncbi:unnamed protein product [Toxocara canis]|uniref:Transposase n=1 Tax=Toxocara canis TaxID=6265 RepID=A0A183TZ75_TOXCA|nr:unnamed protein product [Toxocara canis]